MGDQAYGTAGAVIGGVIGYFAGGNVVLGAQIGYAGGSQIDARENNKKSPRKEPELQNKRITAADYGTPLPIAYGRAKVNGVLIWGTNLYQEVVPGSDDPGGKGGGGNGSAGPAGAKYNTFARFAVKLCNGPIIGLSRLWLDDKLYLDARSSSTGAIAQQGLGSTSGQVQSGKEEISANTSNGHVTIYTGSETQIPNDYMESWLGVGNVNAHRGDALLVFHTLLVNDFGKRIPNVTAEVIVAGDFVDVASDYYTLDYYNSNAASATLMIMSPDGIVWDKYTNRILTKIQVTTISVTDNGWNVEAIEPGTHEQIFSVSTQEGANDVLRTWHWSLDPLGPYAWMMDMQYLNVISTENGQTIVRSTKTGLTGYSNTAVMNAIVISSKNYVWVSSDTTSKIFVLSRDAILQGNTMAAAKVAEISITVPGGSMQLRYVPHRDWVIVQGWATTDSNKAAILDSNGSTILAMAELFSGAVSGTFNSGAMQVDEVNDCAWFVATGSSVKRLYRFDFATLSSVLIYTEASTSDFRIRHALAVDDAAGQVIMYADVNKTLKRLDYDGNLISEIDIAAEQTAYGFPCFIENIPSTAELAVYWSQTERKVKFYAYDRLSGTSAVLSDVVTDIAERVGLSVSDLDVTDLAAVSVNGYAIDSRTQARAAIEPLKRIGFFDLVHEDGKVKATVFGGASVMTINYQDLLIPDDGENKRPYSIKRANEIDLPQSFEVAYSDVDFDYETNLQTATRSTRRSKTKAIFTIPAAITGDVAKRSAEVALYQAWAARTTWILNGSRKHWALNIGDPFTFVDETGASRRLLCVSREMLGFTRMTITAIEDDASVYSNTATGSAPTWVPPVISAVTLKQLSLLDIPILRDQDDYPGFYAIADSSAPSAILYESVDGGITFNSLGALQEADSGYAITTLADFTGGSVWDDVSTLSVRLYSGTLESVTDAQVLAGLNAAVVGNEIIQYATATLTGTNTYTLSRLLRGRKGTEWAISTHGAGERFVPLTTSISRISSSVRGAQRLYKAVRVGASITDSPAIPFTNTQAGMKPYSVVNIAGSRDGSNNLTITWARRSRIGTAWGVTDALPLDDTVESYQVDIMSGSVVKRTISSSTPTCAYSAADQTTDFGGVQLSLLVNVYQMSTIVGRGTVSAKTI